MTCIARQLSVAVNPGRNAMWGAGYWRGLYIRTWCNLPKGLMNSPSEGPFAVESSTLTVESFNWFYGPVPAIALTPWDPEADCVDCRKAIQEALVRRDERLASGMGVL